MVALKEPKGVVFDESEHTYTNADGKRLSGVTGLLGRQLFKSKYAGIDEEVMARAAERGNLIHRQIEMYESFGGENFADEVSEYTKLKAKNGFNTIATELLVSDMENVASSIDVVFTKDDKIFLCDIKTTSKLDMEYLSWQLSIYKYLLLINNPKAKVEGLVACWLPKEKYGEPKLVEVEEKPTEWIQDLIEVDSKGGVWVNPEKELQLMKEQGLVVPQNLTEAISQVLIMEKVAKECKEKLRALMEEHGITKWESNDFVATIGKPSTSTTFDSKAFKEADPDTYKSYLKTTEKKGSFTIKLK